MSSSASVRAIDVGYGNTKFTVDDQGTCKLFPSLAPLADPSTDHMSFYQRRQTRIVHVDGNGYEVGPDSTLFETQRPLHSGYIDTPQYRALVYGALDEMEVDRVKLLVLGLPVQLHESRSARLKWVFEGTHTIRQSTCISIEKVAVVAQPLGGFVSYCYRPENWALAQNQTFLLIDPGFYTFDWLGTRGLKALPGMSGSVDCGVSHFLRKLLRNVRCDHRSLNCDLRRLDEGLRTSSFKVFGESIDLAPYVERSLPIADQAIQALKNQVGDAEQFDRIFVVGGGSAIFEPLIRRAFPKHSVQVSDEPVLANVRGFHIIGDLLLRQQAAA